MDSFCPNCFCNSCNRVREAEEAEYKKNNPPPTPPEGYRLVVAHYSDHNTGSSRTEYAAVKAATPFEPRWEDLGENAESFPAGTAPVDYHHSEWGGPVWLPSESLGWKHGEWQSVTRLPLNLLDLEPT